MSTQINAAQNNFANQAAELNTPTTKKTQQDIEEQVSKTAIESEHLEAQLKSLEEQQLVANNLLDTEEKLSEQEKTLVIDQALEVISDFMQLSSRNINFQQDDVSDKTVIKFFDAESKELIKQFPSEEVLEIAQKIVALRQDVGEKTGIFLEERV